MGAAPDQTGEYPTW